MGTKTEELSSFIQNTIEKHDSETATIIIMEELAIQQAKNISSNPVLCDNSPQICDGCGELKQGCMCYVNSRDKFLNDLR